MDDYRFLKLRGKQMKKIQAGLILLLMTVPVVASASSEFLMKSTADAKYKTLIQCIKSNDNDSSRCLEEYRDYFKAEIELIKGFPEKKEEYGTRLSKTVKYLKQSVDVFYNKAQDTKDLAYYEKAAKCATLLVKLSDKYSSYNDVVAAYEDAKKGKLVSGTLGALLRKVKSLEYPSENYINNFKPLVDKALVDLDGLDDNFKDELFDLCVKMISEFIQHIEMIEKDLSLTKRPSYEGVFDKYRIYKIASAYPGVASRNDQIQAIRDKIGVNIQSRLEELVSLQTEMIDQYLGGKYSPLMDDQVDLRRLSEVVFSSVEIAHNSEDMILSMPEISAGRKADLQATSNFLDAVCLAQQQVDKQDFLVALRTMESALSEKTESRLLNKAEGERLKYIEQAVKYVEDGSERLCNDNEYMEALALIKEYSSMPLNQHQVQRLTELKSTVETDGRRYVLEIAEKLKSQGSYMDALKTIDYAQQIGLDRGLTNFYDELKNGFDYTQITSLQDAEYFVSCQGGLLNNLENPSRVDKNTFCRSPIEIAQQMTPTKCRGYVLGYDKEVIVNIINKALVGSAFEGKTVVAVFRFSGTEKVQRAIGSVSILPVIEVIYL